MADDARDRKRRRALSHVGGTTEIAGDRTIANELAAALDVPSAPPASAETGPERADDADRVHVHGFHTYPARMHPVTASRLVRALSADRATILDPFCGSGTVLVEASLAGRKAIGTDLNPLAVRLARLKTTRFDESALAALVTEARTVAAFADDRRARRAGATHRYAREDVELFDPHVLLELDSIRAAIRTPASAETSRDPGTEGVLELVLSAILVKLSRRASDTSGATAPRRIAAGYPARLFVRKTEELTRRLTAFAQMHPPDAPPAHVDLDDATRLRTVPASTVDAIIGSPPYVATYDYLAHHALRMRWLGLDERPFSSGEIGARRRYSNLDAASARQAWSRELGAVLSAMARVCRKGGTVTFLIADSAVAGEALRADAILASVAEGSGFTLLARASQPRPHFHGPTAAAFRRSPRSEHAIALQKR